MYSDFAKLNDYRRDGKLCDVTIQVQKKTFKCHRVILALASGYFEMMFAGNFVEKCADNVVLHDIDADTFEEILESIYTGNEIWVNVDNVHRLLRTSEFLKIRHIENRCIEYITENVFSLTVDDMLGIFNFACATNTIPLIDTLSQFIIQFFYKYSQSDTILEIFIDSLKILLTRYRLPLPAFHMLPMLDENVLLDVVIRWVRHNLKQRRKYFKELVELVDYEQISKEYIEFLLKEYKIDSPTSEIWEDRSTFKKYLIDYFSNMESKSATEKMDDAEDSDKLSAPYLDVQFPALHVYVDLSGSASRKRWVFSISKFKPNWFISSTSLSERPPEQQEKVYNSRAPSRDWDDFYIRNVTLENSDYLYCLETNSQYKSVRKRHQLFYAYPSIERSSSDRLFLREPPIFIPSFDLCSLQNCIYLYDSNVHCNSGVYSRPLPYWLNFDYDEIHRGIFRYDCNADRWMPMKPMRKKMSGASITSDKNRIYLIGGRDMGSENHKGYVQAYDNRVPKWHKIAKTNNLYYHGRSCCLSDRIYVSDGKNMEVYDPVAQKWEEIACDKVLKNSGDFIMLPYENQLWFISGRSGRISKSRGSTEMQEPIITTYDSISREWCSSEALNTEIDRTVESYNLYTSRISNYPIVKDAIVYRPLEPWVMP